MQGRRGREEAAACRASVGEEKLAAACRRGVQGRRGREEKLRLCLWIGSPREVFILWLYFFFSEH